MLPVLPSLSGPSDPWGPPAAVPEALKFNNAPYAPFSKCDKLGKAADWAAESGKDGKDAKRTQHGRNYRDPYYAYGANAASFFTNDEEAGNVSAFSVVDSTKQPPNRLRTQNNAVLKTRGGMSMTNGGVSGARQANGAVSGGPGGAGGPGGFKAAGGRGGYSPAQGGRGGYAGPQGNRGGPGGPGGPGGHGGGPGGPGGARRPGGPGFSNWKDYDKVQTNREPSVAVGGDWELVRTIAFGDLAKLSFEVPQGQTLADYGYMYHYNKALDKPVVNARLRPLDRTVYNVTTSDDPVIQKLAQDKAGSVFVTETILSLLMCATKTVLPWDIVIAKADGRIFLDKRDGGPLDFVTVDENSPDAPAIAETDKAVVGINSAAALAIEATYINQNFVANSVVESGPGGAKVPTHAFANANPFHTAEAEAESSDPLLAQGYRYRVFNLADDPAEDEPLNLVVRAKIDAVQMSNGNLRLATINALNEYGGSTGVLEWRNKFSNQRGAIVAKEMKTNLCKLMRWSAQAIVAGADTMKLGFVSRTLPKDNTQHMIVGVLARDPVQFATQLNLNFKNAWGIVKSLINIASALDDGRYVLMRDPNQPTVKLYKVPEGVDL